MTPGKTGEWTEQKSVQTKKPQRKVAAFCVATVHITMFIMEEMKPGGQESAQQEKVKLTDEQKAHIRAEMAKCENPQDARIRRRELARETGASIKQISAVSAYKVGPEGLNLRPQFPKTSNTSDVPAAPLEVTPQIEEMYDNPTKKAWREKIREVVESDFSKETLRNARVVCLPGQALQEVTEIYAKLGIPPQNIVCIERNKEVAKTMRANADAMKLPVNIFEGSIEEFLQSPHEPVTIASFDFLGPLHKSFLQNLQHLHTTDRFMMITNFLQRRERIGEQVSLSAQAAIRREVLRQIQSGEVREGTPWTPGSFEKVRDDVVQGRTSMDLSDAREEGMIDTLHICLEPDLYTRPLDAIYAEAGVPTPPFGPDEQHDFIYMACVEAQTMIKSAFDKHPELSKKIARLIPRSSRELGVIYLEPHEKGYLDMIRSTMGFAMIRRTISDIRLFKYTSESSGSPYQTDIFVEHDIGNDLRRDHRSAYGFLREFVRVLGYFGKEGTSIRLEKFNKTLSENYSGGLTAITLELRANGTSFGRVSLHNLTRLIDYCNSTVLAQRKNTPEELYERPRIEIKAAT